MDRSPISAVLHETERVLFKKVQNREKRRKLREKYEDELLSNESFDIKKLIIEFDVVEYRDSGTAWEKTGFVVPIYTIVDCLYFGDQYCEIIKDYKIGSGHIPPEKISQLVDYKSTLDSQLKRQFEMLRPAHRLIRELFINFYEATETEMLNRQRDENPDEYQVKAPKGWFEFLFETIDTYERVIKRSTTTSVDNILSPIRNNQSVDNDFKSEICTSIMNFCREREPYLKQANKIAAQLYAIDILLEDRQQKKEPRSLDWVLGEIMQDLLPDPQNIALEFTQKPKNKAGRYSVKEIADVMKETKKYLIKNRNLFIENSDDIINGKVSGSIIGKISAIEKEIQSDIGVLNTRKHWIKIYSEAAGFLTEYKQLKEKEQLS